VFGLEGDIDATDIKRGFALGVAPTGGIFIPGDAFRFKNDWQASLRARGGIAFDRVLVYATGGVAWAGVTTEAFYSPGFVGAVAVPGAFASDRQTLVGATVGGGVEVAVTNNVSFGVEYRYSDFGHETFNLGAVPFPAGAGSAVTSNVDLKTHEVTARLNFKFGGLFLP
jgi:outer membrane immunogenic protein